MLTSYDKEKRPPTFCSSSKTPGCAPSASKESRHCRTTSSMILLYTFPFVTDTGISSDILTCTDTRGVVRTHYLTVRHPGQSELGNG